MAEIGAFGPVVFQVSSELVRNFDRLSEDRRARYATHDLLSLEQRLQYLGLDLARVDFAMSFHAAFCQPNKELDALQGVLESHEAQALVIGPKNFGEFVLETIRGTWNHTSNKGVCLHATADVSLREYR